MRGMVVTREAAMSSFAKVLALAVPLLLLAAEARAQETPVDAELCLASDGSGSISDEEFRFQRQGYAAALTDSRVMEVIEVGYHGRIALAYMEWGGPQSMEEIVPWRLIDGAAAAKGFADALVAAPRRAFGWNSISNAIAFCHEWLDSNAYEGQRKIIDVSGDAGQRGGVPLSFARQQAIDGGATINALALNFRGGGLTGPGGTPLLRHFEDDVIGGRSAFALAVDNPDRFVEALVRKLILELAGGKGLVGGMP